MTDNNSKISFIEKTGSAMRINQTIIALESSSAAHKEIIVPKGDVHIAEQILNNKNLNGKISIKAIWFCHGNSKI
ncbi:MAG: hypothetical protein ACYCXQ_03630 [Candidatus Humimicrobiaceae bacterium]